MESIRGDCPEGDCPGGSCPGGDCPDTNSYIYVADAVGLTLVDLMQLVSKAAVLFEITRNDYWRPLGR